MLAINLFIIYHFIVCVYFIALFSTLEQIYSAHMWFYMSD